MKSPLTGSFSTAPRIAVPVRRISDPTSSIGNVGVRSSYLEALVAAGAVPIPIVFGLPEEAVASVLRQCQGVLLTGGEDVGPENYGEEPRPELGVVDEERDRLELFVTRWTMQNGLPLLAICRGMQLLNVACGGTLYQDLPTQFSSMISHAAAAHGGWEILSHQLDIVCDTRLAAILSGARTVGVNSLHHQAIKELGEGLTVSGRSPDGLVEAVEGKVNGPFLIGVQCHPETLWRVAETRWRALFEAFVAAAQARLD